MKNKKIKKRKKVNELFKKVSNENYVGNASLRGIISVTEIGEDHRYFCRINYPKLKSH